MSHIKKIFFYFTAILLITVIAHEKSIALTYSIHSAPTDLNGQLLIENFQSPTIMAADNQFFLVYEIFVTNFQGEMIEVTSLKIEDPNKKIIISQFEGDAIAKIIRLSGSEESEKSPLVFQPGITKLIYLWLPFVTKGIIPDNLIHTLSFATKANNKLNFSASSIVDVDKKYSTPILGKPLNGDNWIATAPSNIGHHRMAYIISDNKIIFDERFAIDFIKTGDNGSAFRGDERKNENYFCYGENIISVADGRVAKIQDGIPDNVPHTDTMAVPFSLKNGPGNYVAIDIGQGQYAFYAHIMKGSIKVKEGDFVKKGEVLAKVGNSGHSLEPHLHFQIANSSSLTESNSYPYVFEQFYKQNASVTMDNKSSKGLSSSMILYKISRIR